MVFVYNAIEAKFFIVYFEVTVLVFIPLAFVLLLSLSSYIMSVTSECQR